uniref:S5 DRBM domain-containing protein n=1 Tax=Brugia timori TaxID=42155 RepID=A0A0R3Q6S6_9BILA
MMELENKLSHAEIIEVNGDSVMFGAAVTLSMLSDDDSEVEYIYKIVVSAATDNKAINGPFDDLYLIAGQKPVSVFAKKSISGLQIRKGATVGCKVTLRRDKMYEFLERGMDVNIVTSTASDKEAKELLLAFEFPCFVKKVKRRGVAASTDIPAGVSVECNDVNGFSVDLEINGIVCKAECDGKYLTVYLGYSHNIKYKVPKDVEINLNLIGIFMLNNDEKGVTLTFVSTLDAKIKDVCKRGINTESIKQVSSLMIERPSNMKLEQKLVFDRGAAFSFSRRVSTVTKGGRRFSFSVLVVTGDEKGRVGCRMGKHAEVAEARIKVVNAAKKSMIRVYLREGRTLHHDIKAKFCSGEIVL